MIEVGVLAVTAIGIAGDFLAGVAQDVAASAVTDLVRQRLQSTEEGATTLARLEEAPQDASRRVDAAARLAAASEGDPSYVQALSDAVQLRSQTVIQGTATTGAPHHQVYINGGGVTGKNAQVAGGDIDSSKRTNRFGIGGSAWVLLLVGGVVASGLIYVALGGGSHSGAPGTGAFGPGYGTSLVGAAPGEDGVRETWAAYTKAWSNKDAVTACALQTPQARIQLEQKVGKCERFFEEGFQGADAETLGAPVNGTVELSDVTVKGRSAELVLLDRGAPQEGATYLYMERFSDRWRISQNFLYRAFHDCPSSPEELAKIRITGGDENCLVGVG
ncbi:hypothetical protein [Streptomyces eurythermus]|uniref:hypothetical protein n=1 Tax=Streptomyces eurythermus TaxID=42237 RepID=UPI0036F65340